MALASKFLCRFALSAIFKINALSFPHWHCWELHLWGGWATSRADLHQRSLRLGRERQSSWAAVLWNA